MSSYNLDSRFARSLALLILSCIVKFRRFHFFWFYKLICCEKHVCFWEYSSKFMFYWSEENCFRFSWSWFICLDWSLSWFFCMIKISKLDWDQWRFLCNLLLVSLMSRKNQDDNEVRDVFSTRCELTKLRNLIRCLTSQRLIKKMTHLKWFLTSTWRRWWLKNSIASIR